MEPLLFEFGVDSGVAHAFETWTSAVAKWWPSDHTISGEKNAEVVFQTMVGGRIFERTPDGTEYDWGEVLVWEPPGRLVYLWHIGSDRSDATEVEVTFTSQDDQTTVRIEHRGWERLGSTADARRTANTGGWTALMPIYIEACR